MSVVLVPKERHALAPQLVFPVDGRVVYHAKECVHWASGMLQYISKLVCRAFLVAILLCCMPMVWMIIVRC